MARPVDNFEWSTDTNYTTGPDAGTPTKVAPSSGEIDEGFVRKSAASPQHMNWLFARVQDWLTYLAGLATDEEFLSSTFAWTGDHTFASDVATVSGAGLNVAGNIRQGLRSVTKLYPLTQVSATAGGSTVAFLGNNGLALYGGSIQCRVQFDLPIGSTLTGVRVGVKSTGNGSGTPINISLNRVTCDTTAPTSANVTGSSVGADTAVAGTYDILDTGIVSAAVNAGSYLQLFIGGGTDAVVGDQDVVLWIEVTYTTTHADPNT